MATKTSTSNKVPFDEHFELDSAMNFNASITDPVGYMFTLSIAGVDLTGNVNHMIPLFTPESIDAKQNVIGPFETYQFSKLSEDLIYCSLFVTDGMYGDITQAIQNKSQNTVEGTYSCFRHNDHSGDDGDYEMYISHDPGLGGGCFRAKLAPLSGGKDGPLMKKRRPINEYSTKGWVLSLALKGEDWKDKGEQGVQEFYNKDDKEMHTWGTPPAA